MRQQLGIDSFQAVELMSELELEFDVEIPSSRPGRRPYRIARGHDGAIAHFPRCESWVHGGPRICRPADWPGLPGA